MELFLISEFMII